MRPLPSPCSLPLAPCPVAARRAFTLVEIIVVMGLIALFTGVIGYAFMRGGNSTVGLQSAQSTISGLLTLVRSQAAVSGRNAALFVNVNATNPDRYLRFLVPAVRDEAGTAWIPLSTGVLLPSGCYVVPPTVPSGAEVETGAVWTNLNSTALVNSPDEALVSASTEAWKITEFTSRGTTANSGQIVVASGRPNPPGTTPVFVFSNPENVRGVSLSPYGLTRLINEKAGFLP